MYRTIEEVIDYLHQNGISYYYIHDDLSVDVYESITIFSYINNDRTYVPIVFNKVLGGFNMPSNNLESLTGLPHTINGSCILSYNNIKSLRGLPKKISGRLSIHQNPIETTQENYDIISACDYVYLECPGYFKHFIERKKILDKLINE